MRQPLTESVSSSDKCELKLAMWQTVAACVVRMVPKDGRYAMSAVQQIGTVLA